MTTKEFALSTSMWLSASTFQAPSLYASASLLIVLFEVLAKFRFKEGFGPFGCLNYVVV